MEPAPSGWSATPQVAVAPAALPHDHADPREIRIPGLKVRSSLERLKLDDAGVIVPPRAALRAGWFEQGTQPGDAGPAVIAGHVDSKTGPGVFAKLGEIPKGAEILVEDTAGAVVTFVVDQVVTYPKDRFPTDAVYGPTPDPQLRLVTCGGSFDEGRGHYTDNVIVFASVRLSPIASGLNLVIFFPVVAHIGRLVAGQYRLVEKIGRGGFGVVWRAQDERLHREVAVKELYLPAYLAEGQRSERRNRSLREARSAARIDHPGAVTVFDVVEEDDCPFIVMELLRGRSLEDVVKENGPLPIEQVAEIGLQLLETLGAAHAAGVVHRDVKPSNVLITEARAVLTDFGIATIEGETSITQSGFVMGAPAYCSPERARGDKAGAAADLWSLGATLYYAVEGHQPFPGVNANQVFHAILTAPHRPMRRAGLLEPLLEGLLIKDVDQRLTASDTALLLEGASAQSTRALVALPVEKPRTARLNRIRRHRIFIPVALLSIATASAVVWDAGFRPDDTGAERVQTKREASRLYTELAPLIKSVGEVHSLAVNPDGDRLAIGSHDPQVRVMNLDKMEIDRTYPAAGCCVHVVAYGPDGSLAAGGYAGEIRVWLANEPEPPRDLAAKGNQIRSLSFSPDGKRLVSASSSVRLWNLANGKDTPVAGEGTLLVADYPPKGDKVAFVDATKVQVGRRTITETLSFVNAVDHSPDGTMLALGDEGGRVKLVRVPRGSEIKTLQTKDRSVRAVAFSPDGKTIACAAGDVILLWDVATKKKVAELEGHTSRVNAVAFSPDSKKLYSGGADKTVRTWQL